MTNAVRILCVCGAIAMWAGIPAAQADDFNLIKQKGQVSLGAFTNNSEVDVQVDGDTSNGTPVDWDRTFGDKDVTRLRLDGIWRFNERHHLRMMYTDYSREVNETIEEEIVWDDDVIPVNATVRAEQKFSIIEASYEYAFMSSDKFELAGSIGLHYTDFEVSLRADVPASGGGTVSIGGPASVDAPLPVLGARTMWRMGGNFYLDAQAQFFAISFDEFDGTITNFRAAVIWQPKKYLGIGAGFDNFKIDVDVEKDTFTGDMDWTYSGPQVFFNFSF